MTQKRERVHRAGKPMFSGLKEKLSGVREWKSPLIVLEGSKRLTVHGCRRILSYTTEELLLSLGGSALRIEGGRLRCSSFSGGAITVLGEIQGMRYEHPPQEREVLE